MSDRRHLRKAARVVGVLFFVVAGYFIFARLGSDLAALGSQDWHWRPLDTLGVIVATISMLLAMLGGWVLSIRYAGGRLDLRAGFRIYYRTNILRYLPGGFWNFPGRAYLARQADISVRTFNLGTFFELFFLLSSGAFIAVLSIAFQARSIWWGALSGAVCLAALLMGVLASYRWLVPQPPEASTRVVWSLAVDGGTIFLTYALVWIAFSSVMIGLFNIVPGHTHPAPLDVVKANTAAWMTGFFSFAPAGLGVRELGFAEILGPSFAAQAVLVSACQRALEVLIEVCLWLASFGVRESPR